VVGIANIENSIIPIIDLEVLLGMKEKEISPNAIAIIVSIEAAVFGLYTIDLPKVISLEKIGQEAPEGFKVEFPEEWISGYSKEEGQIIPVLNPEMFWIGLGSSEINGPTIKSDRISQDQVTFISKEAEEKLEVEKQVEEAKAKKPKEEKKKKKTKKGKKEEKLEVEKQVEEAKTQKPEEEKKEKKKRGKKKKKIDEVVEENNSPDSSEIATEEEQNNEESS
jgi:valyl-tRNA synthetase